MARTPCYLLLLALSACAAQAAEFDPEQTIRAAEAALRSLMSDADEAIPADVFARAQGLLIIPTLKRASVIVGTTEAHGIVIARAENGEWGIPQFVVLSERSLGAQMGKTSSDVFQVFMTRESIDTFLRTGELKLGIGVHARIPSITESAVVRNLARRRDSQRDIRHYGRGRGMSVGLLAATTMFLRLDGAAQSAYYRARPTQGTVSLPAGASALLATVEGFCRPAPEVRATPLPGVVPVVAQPPRPPVRR